MKILITEDQQDELFSIIEPLPGREGFILPGGGRLTFDQFNGRLGEEYVFAVGQDVFVHKGCANSPLKYRIASDAEFRAIRVASFPETITRDDVFIATACVLYGLLPMSDPLIVGISAAVSRPESSVGELGLAFGEFALATKVRSGAVTMACSTQTRPS